MTCDICNCPLTLLRNPCGKKERRRICVQCREEQSTQGQVEMLVETAKELAPPPPPKRTEASGTKPLAPVLRIDYYLKSRAKRKPLLM